MARTSRAASPAPAAPAEVEEPVVLPKVDPDPQPITVDPFLIGPPSDPMTPGWLMGIGSRPETPAEHAARLGASAGTFTDAGFIMGTLEPRPEWPAQPPVVEPVPVVLELDHIDPGTTKVHFHLEGATTPVLYDFGDSLTHTPVGSDTAHTYAEPGTYTVTTTDAEGAEASIEIEVPAPA